MRAHIQRVSKASVKIDGFESRSINKGLLVLVAFHHLDGQADLDWTLRKLLALRIFPDDQGKMNLSVADIGGELLIISQFTLFASTKKGNRPSFVNSAGPEIAIPLYKKFLSNLSELYKGNIQTGEFGAYMEVDISNDGPVTILLDSKNPE